MSGRWLPEAEGGFGGPRGVMGGTPGGQEAGEETGLQHRGARRATGAGAEPRTKQRGGGNAGPSQPLKAPRAAAVRKGKRRCSSSRGADGGLEQPRVLKREAKSGIHTSCRRRASEAQE